MNHTPLGKTPSKALALTFLFSEANMQQLLKAYYYGGSRDWHSYLERLDMQAPGPRYSSGSFDRSQLSDGNPLLRQFTHRQVDWALGELRQFESVRAGKRISGWLEYCLKVSIGKENPKSEANATMPEVRAQDKVKAMLALGQLLSQVIDHIDRPRERIRKETRLNQLMQQLDGLNN